MHLTCTNMPKEKVDIALRVSYSLDSYSDISLRAVNSIGSKATWV
jgi:hypothetical protein